MRKEPDHPDLTTTNSHNHARIPVVDGSDAVPAEPAEEAKGETGGYSCQRIAALAKSGGVTTASPGTTGACGKTVYAGFALR
ncbi:hypothetical protein LG634_19310 [Streptomyces bambusae]|uniref:hypothetical protein n=1 Tax=Streptomyces bambusae TaxID=1550616 RepID=UPI001CFF5096|nr:hypothetical protein [Streptomyces bambusae]MCB5166979.1 hypothetical protein [Streptomyces bambusae]